jgi:hypothetical protein
MRQVCGITTQSRARIEFFHRKNAVDFRRRSGNLFEPFMKCETTNAVLTFVLGVLAVAGVIFAMRTGIQTHELRLINNQDAVERMYLMQAQALVNDVIAYNQKNPSPELARLLQSIQAKPAGAK